ncbi:unnamed protein product [Staurois parvus]|uniref:Uncharacterized protein n=1 Tax=Staurois parvus TaxID=386267 RepID=A0ABN9BF12_9NEOB|nr:unnamed protein product [Staurois parvus]
MADSSVSAFMEQCVVIKFLVNKGIKPTDIYRRLQAQYVTYLNGVKVSKMAIRLAVAIPAVLVPSPQQSFLLTFSTWNA